MKVFIGIKMNQSWKRYLSDTALALKAMEVKGNYTYADNYHLTIKFIGQLESDEVKVLDDILESLLENVDSFELQVGELGVFPKKNRGIYWMGIEASSELESLFYKIEEDLSGMGIKREERPFAPHITLLRQGRPIDAIVRNRMDLPPLLVDEIILYESININGKLEYVPIKRYPLEVK